MMEFYIFLSVFGGIILLLIGFALINYPFSVYSHRPEQKNPFEGKKVIFVYDENDLENADGIKGHLSTVGDIASKRKAYSFFKRLFDVILSFFALILLSPLFLIISFAIFINDPGRIFFTQKRVGKNKRFFVLHKFRSMRMNTPHDTPTHMLGDSEKYITAVGKFLRRHSLDELPQIWDIFIGNMSIIGPRPALWNQDLLISERDKYSANNIKPGLTGWAQIHGRDEILIDEKAKLDGYYAQHYGIRIDIKCFLLSLKVFKGDSSVVEGKNSSNENEKEIHE